MNQGQMDGGTKIKMKSYRHKTRHQFTLKDRRIKFLGAIRHTHTHTHTQSHSLTHSLTHSITHSHTHTHTNIYRILLIEPAKQVLKLEKKMLSSTLFSIEDSVCKRTLQTPRIIFKSRIRILRSTCFTI